MDKQDIKEEIIKKSIEEFILNFRHPKKKFYLLNCEPSKDWLGIYEALYQSYFREPNQEWIFKNISKNEKLNSETISEMDAFIITGSSQSTYDDNLSWLPYLFDLIKKVYLSEKGKILGICFGHQALGRGLGGLSEKMKLIEDKPYLLHKNKLTFTSNIRTKNFYNKSRSFNYEEKIFLHQSHGDHVSQIPEKAEILAFSDDTKVEMFCLEEKILGLQSHPEFCDLMMNYRLIHIKKGDEKWKEFCRRSFEVDRVDNWEIVQMCRDFLTG